MTIKKKKKKSDKVRLTFSRSDWQFIESALRRCLDTEVSLIRQIEFGWILREFRRRNAV